MRYVIYACQRCNAEVRMSGSVGQAERDNKLEGWLLDYQFPLPTGHPGRLDATSHEKIDLCKDCHISLNDWWLTKTKKELKR